MLNIALYIPNLELHTRSIIERYSLSKEGRCGEKLGGGNIACQYGVRTPDCTFPIVVELVLHKSQNKT